MHCGPASYENSRMIVARLKNPIMETSRMRLTYDNTQFSDFRCNLKAQLMALIQRA